jgi:catechol 2,3-dioxygenase-like lactoylglutathione lyase family enzyme
MAKHFIHGLAHQAINVRDFAVSKGFYCDVLGMDVLYQDSGHVFLKVGEGENFGILALLGAPKSGPAPVDPRERQGNLYNHFGFRAKSSSEVYAFAEHLKKHNVQIIKGPYTRKDGSSVYFLDPDGYTLEYLYLIEDPKAYAP